MRAHATRPTAVLLVLLAAAVAAATPVRAQTSPRPPGYALLSDLVALVDQAARGASEPAAVSADLLGLFGHFRRKQGVEADLGWHRPVGSTRGASGRCLARRLHPD